MKNNMEIYKLKKMNETRWLVCDTANSVMVSFEAGKFNETQKVSIPDEMDWREATKAVTAIADWLSIYHYQLAMGGEQTAAELIGWQVSSLRRAAGMSQRELAERCGITQQQLARIERANHATSVDTIAAVLEKLGHRLTIEPII